MPSITDSIGRVLGGRYRLVTALGTGASAHVYLADDVSLHRRVAIKVLHPALSGDSAFLKRFRAEARAAAALNHPNILQVYDWGEEHDEPYLVLEYLAGGSLRQVFDTGALLTPEQAVQVGIEVAAGLEYAHRRGVVHRDIKPANLLFDADRRLRIADFGLARALAEASWTEPDGAILGTARYSAPEQVEGWVLDGKADVYALALVLYEAVTGEAAFIGDTTVSTLMARVGTLLPEHRALGPLNDVLVWAAAPDPAERYDASQLGQRLQALAVALPRPDPLPITEAVPGHDDIDTGVVRPHRRTGLDADPTELGAPAALDPSPVDRTKPSAGRPSPGLRRRRRRWPWWAAAGVVVAALVAAGIVSGHPSGPLHPEPPGAGAGGQDDRPGRGRPGQGQVPPACDRAPEQHHTRCRAHREPETVTPGRHHCCLRQAGHHHRRRGVHRAAAGGHPQPQLGRQLHRRHPDVGVRPPGRECARPRPPSTARRWWPAPWWPPPPPARHPTARR